MPKLHDGIRTVRRACRISAMPCLTLFATGCAGAIGVEDAPEAETRPPASASVTKPPFEGPPSDINYPPLNTGEPTANGSFSTFVQLAEPPGNISDGVDTGTSREVRWRAFVAGDAFTTPPMLATQLERATGQLRTQSESGNDLLAIMQPLRSILPNQDQTLFPSIRLTSYRPERARWLAAESNASGTEGVVYPDMPGLSELRNRGERLYCAAKNAARKQREQPQSVIMGRRDLIKIPLLDLVILRVEPTLAIEEPMRLDSGQNDGAQAFVLPFQAGVRASIFPQLGLSFLKFPEMTLPVNMLLADSEVVTPIDFGERGRQKWGTATHATAFGSSAFEGLAESNNIPLPFKVGPISLYLRLGLSAGMASCSEHDLYPNCRTTPVRQVGRLIDRVLTMPGQGWVPLAPGPRGVWDGEQTNGFTRADWRAGIVDGDYNDAPWNVDTQLWQGIIPGNSLAPFRTTLPDPLAARMVQNNDKSMMVETNYGLTFALIGQAGLRQPEMGNTYVQFSADVRAAFSLSTTVLHRFREQEEVQTRLETVHTPEFDPVIRTPSPLTALTVTPGTQLEPIGLDLSGAVDIAVHGGPFTLAFRLKLFRVGTTVGDAGTPSWWSEGHRLRMTTMQSFKGNVESNVISHLPSGAPYPTFEDRATCAAPQTTPPPPYRRCEAEPATGGRAVDLPLCLVVPVRQVEPDHDRDPELGCFVRVEPWFRSGTSREQEFHGGRAVARVLTSSADYQGAAQAAIDCANEYVRVGRPPQDATSFVQFVPCDAAGNLLEEPIAPQIDMSAPAPGSTAAPCHP